MVENTKSIPFPVLELSDTSWINQLDVAITSTREKDLGFSGWKDKSSTLPIFCPSVARLADEIKKYWAKKQEAA